MSTESTVPPIRRIEVADTHPLLDRTGMDCKVFGSDFRQIRFYTLLVVQKAPPEIREINLLEQQVSELIKNAIKHGNRCDPVRKVTVWYSFAPRLVRVIVQDQGMGFQHVEQWNEFHRIRSELLTSGDFDKLQDYVSFRGEGSDDNDGGNALFAALEYWNGGVVLDGARTTIATMKTFPGHPIGVEI